MTTKYPTAPTDLPTQPTDLPAPTNEPQVVELEPHEVLVTFEDPPQPTDLPAATIPRHESNADMMTARCTPVGQLPLDVAATFEASRAEVNRQLDAQRALVARTMALAEQHALDVAASVARVLVGPRDEYKERILHQCLVGAYMLGASEGTRQAIESIVEVTNATRTDDPSGGRL